jgi:hypothetical protein
MTVALLGAFLATMFASLLGLTVVRFVTERSCFVPVLSLGLRGSPTIPLRPFCPCAGLIALGPAGGVSRADIVDVGNVCAMGLMAVMSTLLAQNAPSQKDLRTPVR